MKDKIYKFLNIILIFIMIIISLVLGIKYIRINDYVRVFSAFSIVLTLLLPLLIYKTKYKLNSEELFIFNLFLFSSHFLGSIINLFNTLGWYDTFVHFLSGILTFYISYLILKKAKCKEIKNPFILFLYFIGFTSLIAVGWEIIEYIGDILFNTNFQHNIDTGVNDTMIDMIVAELGCILSYIYYIIIKKH